MIEMKIKDKYGNKVGSVEKGYIHDYKIKDKDGNTIGNADKDLLSSDYTIRTNNGEKIGKFEKNLLSNDYTLKDENGKKVDLTTKSEPDIDFGTGGVIAIIVIILLLFVGIKYIPTFLLDLLDVSDGSCWLLLGPLFLFVIANILMIALKKDQFIADHPIKKELLGATVVTIIDTLIFFIFLWITNSDNRGSFGLDRIFLPIIETIVIIPSLIVVFLPVGLLFGIVIAIKNKK